MFKILEPIPPKRHLDIIEFVSKQKPGSQDWSYQVGLTSVGILD